MSERIPAGPGTYAIALRVARAGRIEVGALGALPFRRGVYLYVGSARGPGGLPARLERHFTGSSALRWHVDYLRARGRPVAALVRSGRRRLECDWARRLTAVSWLDPGPPGFGSSDCGCESHLFRARSGTRLESGFLELAARLSADAVVP